MIRVLHVTTTMNRGGLESMIMNYYRNIDRTKIQFDFLIHRMQTSDFEEEIKSMGGRVFHLPNLNPFSKNYMNSLVDFFNKHSSDYKIVHCHLDCMSAIPLKIAQKAGIPIRIAHSHNSNQTVDLKYPLKLYYKNKINKVATHLFACSYDAGKWMFKNNNFKVLPNAIDSKKYVFNENKRKEYREKLKIKDEIVIGHIGRFYPQKNHKFLIDIFKEINAINRNTKLVLVGVGVLMDEIKSYVNELSLNESVLFLGLRNDVPNLLQVFDVFLFPSLYEGLPVTLVEAQAAGLPCLISDKVPIECKITDLVYQLSLNDDIRLWAEKSLQLSKTLRQNTTYQIEKAGYDIRSNAKKLQEFYLNFNEEN